MGTVFGTDRVLLYDVEPWNTYGFGVPNFGDNVGTLSTPIANLVDEIGQIQLYVMTHVDAMRKQPPSNNTVARIGRLLNRVNTILANRQRDYDVTLLESGHASPAPKIWNIHPVPYFASEVCRNRWLCEYNDLTMIALTNAMQHSDNNLSLTVTKKFAQDVWQYFAEIKRLLGTELLGLPLADVVKEEFVFTDLHFAAYNPSAVTVSIESIDSPGPIFGLPTEDDLKKLLNGIPATLIQPLLRQYPVGPLPGASGLSGPALQPGAGAVQSSGAGAATNPTIGPASV